MKKPVCEAFTLVELLVTIIVLTMLALVLVPALSHTGPDVRMFGCLNNNRRLANAWRMYSEENNDAMVYASEATPLSQDVSRVWVLQSLDYNAQNRSNWDTNTLITGRPLWQYSAGDVRIYKCPADTSVVIRNSVRVPRIRSMSMNFYLGGFGGTTGGIPEASPYRIFLNSPELAILGPSKAFVFLDMREDDINWGNFLTVMSGWTNAPAQYALADLPGFYHHDACTFSFGDGHAEVHRWLDARTTPPLIPGQQIDNNNAIAVPRSVDVAWLQDHSTRPK
jgi:type II secretory pathway pseudopilin PulG